MTNQNGAATELKLIASDAQARAAVEQATKTAGDALKAATSEAVEFGRGNLEAAAKASRIYLIGAQDLGRQGFAFAQGLADQALETAKALTAAKSLKEVTEIQANFARAAFDRALGEGTRLQQAALKVAEQACAPLAERVTAASGKLGRPVAA